MPLGDAFGSVFLVLARVVEVKASDVGFICLPQKVGGWLKAGQLMGFALRSGATDFASIEPPPAPVPGDSARKSVGGDFDITAFVGSLVEASSAHAHVFRALHHLMGVDEIRGDLTAFEPRDLVGQ